MNTPPVGHHVIFTRHHGDIVRSVEFVPGRVSLRLTNEAGPVVGYADIRRGAAKGAT